MNLGDATLSSNPNIEKDERNIGNSKLKTLFFMFCEPKGQELNTFICKKKSDFLTPLGPLGVRPYRFEKKK